MGIDSSKFTYLRQEHRTRLAVLPKFVPNVAVLHDGDVGAGHAVTFYDVPILGPNRVIQVGDPVTHHGGKSYRRGGATATGHTWKVYRDHTEVLGAGTLVASGSGTDFTWTPDTKDTYRVELALANRASDGSTDGARFIRAFDSLTDGDANEEPEVSGSFSIDGGGHELTVTYKPTGDATPIEDWSRIVLEVHTYFDGSANTFDSAGSNMGSNIQFNGIVVEDTISEDPQTETITFKMVTPQAALAKIPLRGYPHTAEEVVGDGGASVTVPIDYPLFFGDPLRSIPIPGGAALNVLAYIRQNDIDIPVHSVNGMTYTDPTYHMLQRHTNFMQWYDVDLWQETAGYLYPFAFQMTNIYDQLKQLQDRRFGVVFCDKKGTLHLIPDIRYNGDIWFETASEPVQMTFDRRQMQNIRVRNNPYRVAQVRLTGMDDKNIPFFSAYSGVGYNGPPDNIGDIVQRGSLFVQLKSLLDTYAQRLYVLYNQPYEVSILAQGINRSLELGDIVTIDYTDAAGRHTL